MRFNGTFGYQIAQSHLEKVDLGAWEMLVF